MEEKKVKIQFGCELNSFDKKGVHIKVGNIEDLKVSESAQKQMLDKFYEAENEYILRDKDI